jgi:hypothetical protein
MFEKKSKPVTRWADTQGSVFDTEDRAHQSNRDIEFKNLISDLLDDFMDKYGEELTFSSIDDFCDFIRNNGDLILNYYNARGDGNAIQKR